MSAQRLLARGGARRLSGARSFSVKAAKQSRSLPAAYYRGGTSRAICFRQRDLPPERADWSPIFRGALGSPDPNGRQLDGLGGGISSLSKICIVAPSKRENVDVDFTFAQVGVKDTVVDYAGTCGNMTSAIGPYALDSGMFKVTKGATSATVRIFNTNTSKVVHATFPLQHGELSSEGDFEISGVAGTGARIDLQFMSPAGAVTGKLLPTGAAVDVFDGIRATCIDVANPMVFVSAEEMGVDGTILPADMEKEKELLQRLESIRGQASAAMGVSKTPADAPTTIPKICLLSSPTTHKLLSGEELAAGSIDIVVRAMSVGQPHRAIPITMALCLGAAVEIRGSVAYGCLSDASKLNGGNDGMSIGHPSGRLTVGTKYDKGGTLVSASVFRTARRLMEGGVFWK